MKLISVLSVACVAAQSTITPKEIINPVLKCFQDKNCGDDVNCKARCVGVPAPTIDLVEKTNACYATCNSTSNDLMVACRTKCDSVFVNSVTSPSTGDSNTPAPGTNSTSNSSKFSNTTNTTSNDAKTSSIIPAISFLTSGLLAFAML
ncbi:hypothetical protein DSO57_1031727 [Entomophthora muscae]|uniref:Uncharacterized protein n=1 Tax=Entomophthora muscae TaxID=34485 RepID=A0ACC2SDI2_9FUNG|nr:hypothetical protein DSO57_1031727 [Entomophthora muscae]